MLLSISENIIKILPILRFELYNEEEAVFLTLTNSIVNVMQILKNHFNYQFKVLTCISGVDYPENLYRFQVVYDLLSIHYNGRVRIKILTDELTPINSIQKVFPAAGWWESEIFDMYGIFFLNHLSLTRLLTDYGFQGYPLRKDFPLSGYTEARYNVIKNRVVYENVELAQEYRTFEFISPWEVFNKK
jgi:NADH/F420H2 dehydrogenase subunit C